MGYNGKKKKVKRRTEGVQTVIGISYHAGGMKDIPLNEVITILADAGYDAIEMMCGPEAHIPSGEVTDSLLREVKTMVTDSGLKSLLLIRLLAAVYTNWQWRINREQLTITRLLQDVAVALGAGGVNFLTGYGGDKGDPFAWRLLVDVLKPICRLAEELGITMNIHNHEATTLDASSKVTLLIEHVGSDALKSLNDITNFYHLGEDIAEVTEKLGP